MSRAPTRNKLRRSQAASDNRARRRNPLGKRLEAYGIVETRQKQGARIVNNSIETMVSILSFRLDSDEKAFRHVRQFRAIPERGLLAEVVARVQPSDIEDLPARTQPSGA